MSLTMTSDEMYEAYGPNGPDEQDIEAWNLAVDRAYDPAEHCEHRNADRDYCPDCGYDAIAAAEQAIGA